MVASLNLHLLIIKADIGPRGSIGRGMDSVLRNKVAGQKARANHHDMATKMGMTLERLIISSRFSTRIECGDIRISQVCMFFEKFHPSF